LLSPRSCKCEGSMRIFVGWPYDADWVEKYALALIESYGFDVMTGKELQGEKITEGVKKRSPMRMRLYSSRQGALKIKMASGKLAHGSSTKSSMRILSTRNLSSSSEKKMSSMRTRFTTSDNILPSEVPTCRAASLNLEKSLTAGAASISRSS